MRRSGIPVVLLAIGSLAAANDSLDATFERDILIIAANEYACYRFDIYLATEFEQQRQGLMHVRQLAQTTGMLFVYSDSDYRSMWMKNTYIPLDISFVDSDGTIVNIVRDTEPLSLKSISSIRPVNYVLELNAGVTERLSIGAGSQLVWGEMPGFRINEQ
ncbi:MAG: DUF192 domain-containing protein [Gammaproteobacteria bacterium]|nr:DUF192 domain-containing protein [Gammaproteobacteria bacterium]